MASTQSSHARIGLVGPLLQAGAADKNGPKAAAMPNANELWDQIIDGLLRMRALANDWDGQGASAPSPANVDRAIAWVREMHRYPQAVPPSRPVPGVTGEVVLEWQGESYYLLAEIVRPDQVEWMLAVDGEPTKHWITEGAMDWLVATVS